MTRAYQNFEHPDVDFITSKGASVSLRWSKNEYRAFKKGPKGDFYEMGLGGAIADNLKEYIMNKF